MNTSSTSFSFAGRGTSDDGMLDNPALYQGVLGHRFWAFMIDILLIAVANAAIHITLFVLIFASLGLLLLPALVIMALVSFLPLAILYDTLTLGGSKSATPGMRLFDIEVHSTAGGRPDYVQAFVMSLLFYVSFSVTSGLILLLVFFTRRKMALHDILSGCVVARRIESRG